MREQNFLDRVIGFVSPGYGLARERARFRIAQLSAARAEYDGATRGRRATGWRRTGRDADGEIGLASKLLRETARDMVRNNPHAATAVTALAAHIVGAGITFQVKRNGKVDDELNKLARELFDTTACDADGQHNLYGLQLLAVRTIVESGACLVRFRQRRLSDGLPLPMQIQLLEPDFLDQTKHGRINDGQQIYGIEFDPIGTRRAYWLYKAHPGSTVGNTIGSVAIPARDVIHCFRADRPGQQHGASWFAPVILRMRDFADFEDAELMRQKIAACHVGVVTGEEDDEVQDDPVELMEPGMIWHAPAGRQIQFNSPPGNNSYDPYSKVSLRAVSAGLGLPYEILTGDLSNVSFISGRLGRLDFYRRVEAWQWLMFLPQFCDGVGRWFLRACEQTGRNIEGVTIEWTPPRREMMDPASEVPAIRDAIRSGQMNLSEALRERGIDPDQHLVERQADNEALDAAGVILDSDPRKVTAVGNPTATPAPERKL